MARSKPQSHSWELDLRDNLALPNATICLALWRCVRRLPGAFPRHSYDDLGLLLAPVFEPHRAVLMTATEAHRAATHDSSPWRDINLQSPDVLHNVGILQLLGEQLVVGDPLFSEAFDEVQKGLESFVAIHWHPYKQNLQFLSDIVRLPEAEQAFLAIAAAFCHGSIERESFDFVDTPSKLQKVLPGVLGVRARSAMRLFDDDQPLVSSGLIAPIANGRRTPDLEDRLQLTLAGERLVSEPFTSTTDMSRAVLSAMAGPNHASAVTPRWPHLERERVLVRTMLTEALASGARGINVLIHGAPGTGKTEFVRQLLAGMGAEGFSVDCVDSRGREADRSDRLANLRLGQAFLSNAPRSVLVLDEAEDIFTGDYNNPLARLFSQNPGSKAWMNALLEDNVRPVVWISNAVDHLDPAYLRRFTFCLEFPRTPYVLRRAVAEQALAGNGCSPEAIEGIASLEGLTPALLASAARFAALAKDSGLGADAAALAHLNQHLRASGHKGPPARPQVQSEFDTRYLNITGSITAESVLRALGSGINSTLLLAGPPGTGKTQFAHEIALRLGRQLVMRTASDINTKWYGESEANVAKMFRECDPTSEVLFLDEADVLLGARSSSSQRADQAVTAEFLRWLEAFEGTFVCATNHAELYDPAMARRFVFRLEFCPLDAGQRRSLFTDWVLGGAAQLDEQTGLRLDHLVGLTPGDFSNVRRRVRALGLPTHAFIEQLELELDAKVSKPRAIGFL